ncbi:MAG: hybrid sensor histidine kinase/response regulator, partial [Opitutus sp.]|nr:hybrid sensor histidine kinase/response regulator [Opitutus sp.]MCS6275638.1 hybrid sensor histidine kinase/response regulator [Opitutus sp.]
ITDLAHVMESVMALLRDGRMIANRDLINLFLSGTDKLKAMVAAPDQAASTDTSAERTALHALLHTEPPKKAAAPDKPILPLYLSGFRIDPELVRNGLHHGQNVYVVQLNLNADIEAKGQTLLDYFRDIEALGTLIDTATEMSGFDGGLDGGGGLGEELAADVICSLLFSTAMEPDLLLCAFNLPENQLTAVPSELLKEWLNTQPTLAPSKSAPVPVAKAAPDPAWHGRPAHGLDSAPPPTALPATVSPSSTVATTPPPAPTSTSITPTPLSPAVPAAPAHGAKPKTEDTVRISVALLDGLMNLAGEMVLGRNQLLRIAAPSRENASATSAPSIDGLASVVQGISGVTTDLQRTIMRARLQPVGGLFGKFNRIIRDLGQKLGKEIQLETVGDDVELDRALIEGLSDPLTHLIRNSADHGIELPAARVAAGKTAAGHVRISAAHLAGRVQIEVRDDGHGLNPEKLKAKAIEKGVITTEQAAKMTESEAWQLIFAPGFSTAAVVSDVSGRGVGMDVVKTNIEKLGGRVEIHSVLGQGTAIIIRLPLTLAIIPALIVGCDTRHFAVPQLNLVEIVRPGPDRPLEAFGASHIIRLREELLPVLNLSALLGLPDRYTADKPGYVLVLKLDNRRFGLQVETIADTEEIVVKPLGRHLQGTSLYSGATLLGQGEIALILDLAGIATGRLPTDTAVRQLTQAAAAVESERILVFKDGTPEIFALHIANIGRIEKIDTSRIERLGGHDYLRQKDGPTLRLLRIQDHLPVTPGAPLPAEVHIIVPRLVYHPVALITEHIMDAADLVTGSLDAVSLRAPGVLGTATINDRLTILLDLYGIMRAAGMDQGAALQEGLSGLRVLVAEDTLFFREAIKRGLHDVFKTLDFAKDGEEAWQRLQKGSYDILITDLEMPRLNGFELTTRIRADARLKNLPVISVSSRDTEDFHERAKVAGINRYETKLDRERLCLAITDVLHPQ